MYISELQIRKDIQNSPQDQDGVGLVKIFGNAGWKVLGFGTEGTVAEHPNKQYVLKVFESDSNYKAFVSFCEKHSGNPHVPVFNRYTKEIPGTPYSYVRMEKLEEIQNDELFDKFLPEMVVMLHIAMMHGIKLHPNVATQISSMFSYELKNSGFKFDDIFKKAKITKLLKAIGRVPDKSWIAIVTDLLNASKSLSLKAGKVDLNPNNFMQRNGTIVIIDPFY